MLTHVGTKKIETKRLLLREYTFDDFNALYEIMSDSENIYFSVVSTKDILQQI